MQLNIINRYFTCIIRGYFTVPHLVLVYYFYLFIIIKFKNGRETRNVFPTDSGFQLNF